MLIDEFMGDVIVYLFGVQNPKDPITKISSFEISTYDSESGVNYLKDYAEPNEALTPNLRCDFPCKTCAEFNTTDCLSCFDDASKKYLSDSKTQIASDPTVGSDLRYEMQGYCYTACPFNTTSNGNAGTCEKCDESCDGCEDNGQIGDD